MRLSIGIVALLCAAAANAQAEFHEIMWRLEPMPLEEWNLTVTRGDFVTWNWADNAPHSVTSPPVAPDGTEPEMYNFDDPVLGTEAVNLTADESYEYRRRFRNLGEFDYNCRVHRTSMVGTITVEPVVHVLSWQFSLSPLPEWNITINVGDVVTWMWDDTAPHSVTSPPALDGAEPESYTFDEPANHSTIALQNHTYSRQFTEVGEFDFNCRQHAGMQGVVNVAVIHDVVWRIAQGGSLDTNLTINMGDYVRWTWSDGFDVPHSVTSPPANDLGENGTTAYLFDDPPLATIAQDGYAYMRQFNDAGLFEYNCRQHASMFGAITVLAPTAPPTTTSTPMPTSTVPTPATPAPEGTIIMWDNSPASLDLEHTIIVGDSVTWVWNDNLPHTVTEVEGLFDDPADGAIVGPYSFTYTFTEVGVYDYFCERHPNTMTGQIIVRPSSTVDAASTISIVVALSITAASSLVALIW